MGKGLAKWAWCLCSSRVPPPQPSVRAMGCMMHMVHMSIFAGALRLLHAVALLPPIMRSLHASPPRHRQRAGPNSTLTLARALPSNDMQHQRRGA